MTFRAIACSALLSLSGLCSAADITYTYTGNIFEQNAITSSPSRLTAHVVFDFEHSPLASENIYAIKHWDVSAAGIYFSSATQSSTFFHSAFVFDGNMNIVDWLITDARMDSFSGFVTNSAGLAYDGRALDLAAAYVIAGPYASVASNPGVWTMAAAPVPEPETYLMLVAGMACLAGVRRRMHSV